MADWLNEYISKNIGTSKTYSAPRTSTRTSSYSGSSGGSSGGGGSYSSSDAAAAAEKAAKAAADRYYQSAETMNAQVDALKKGLKGFSDALNIRLENFQREWKSKDDELLKGWEKRKNTLQGSAKDNDQAAGDTGFSNLANRGRERAASIAQAVMHGAGESDILKSMLPALRNWNANQDESNRSFFDTLRSINTSLTDLNVDTKTARINTEQDINDRRGAAWEDYWRRATDAWTQIGNVRGQQANLYASANEAWADDKYEDKAKDKSEGSGKAFDEAAKLAGMAWKDPGTSKYIKDWEGLKEVKSEKLNTSVFANVANIRDDKKKPQGATLRSWIT